MRARVFWAPIGALLLGALLIFAADVREASAAAKIQRVVSPGGIEAWLVEERSIPIISVSIGFRGGASRETPEEAGLATMFASLLDEGAGPFDAAGFAERGEAIAARMSFSARRDSVRVSATMLADRRDETLELLRLALMEPRFDEEPMLRTKRQMISRIRQSETDPQSLSSQGWLAAKFPDDAYGRSTNGTIETIEAIEPDDLRAARTRFLNRNGMKIGVVGAISAEELGPVLDQLLGELPDAPLAPLPVASVAEVSGIEIVDFDAPQSVVTFGHAGLARDDPDFIPAYVMNYVLGGGGFSSRLFDEVREERGLAYSVYAYLSPLDRAALYLGGVATANERVGESIEVIKAEWASMAESGVTEEELEKAKRYLTGAFPLRFDSNGKIAGYLVGAQLDELGIDYIEIRNDLIEAVTLEDIRRVAARVLKPEGLYFVVVGRPTNIGSQ